MDSKFGFSIFRKKCEKVKQLLFTFAIFYSCAYRDFSNGFLVAEIFSRYYMKEIQMHSYENGTSLKCKRDNWLQLLKIIRKIGIAESITEEETQQVLRCEDGAAVNFICKIYEILTQRKVQTQVKKPTVGKVAGYARETGTWKVRDAMKKNDINDDSDILTASRVAAEAISEHERSLMEEKSFDPDRFSTTSITGKSSQLISKSNGKEEEEVPQVRVKEIQVKQLDRNVTHLRASKQMNSPTNNSKTRAVSPSGQRHFEDSDYGLGGAMAPGNVLPENAVSLLNSCISRVIGPKNMPSWSAMADPFHNFLSSFEMLRQDASVDSLLAACLNEIRLSAQHLADACVVTPKQFWKVSDLFTSAISTAPIDSMTYSAAVEGFEAIGRWTVQRDGKSSLAMFCDFGLMRLAYTVNTHPYKRLGVIRILNSFTPADTASHVQCIKRLQNIIPDIKVFIHCLSILATLETHVDISLLDLYLYYATIGIGMPSPRIRAGATAVIATLYPQAAGMISGMLPQLLSLAGTETWWEIHAHLLSLCGSILDHGSRNEEDYILSNDDQIALEIIDTILTTKSSKMLRQWGVVALAPALFAGEKLVEHYIDILMSLDSSDRRFLLGFDNTQVAHKVELPSATGMAFVLEAVTMRWPAQVVARVLSTSVSRQRIDRLNRAQMEILHACVRGTVEAELLQIAPKSARSQQQADYSELLSESWVQLFNGLRDYVFIGMCDASTADEAAGVLSNYVLYSPLQDSVVLDNKFLGTLRLLYPIDGNGDVTAQLALERFLRDMYETDEFYGAMVVQMIEAFSKNYTANYEMSNLSSLLKDAASKHK